MHNLISNPALYLVATLCSVSPLCYADTPNRRLTNYTVVIRFRQVKKWQVSIIARELGEKHPFIHLEQGLCPLLQQKSHQIR